METVRRTHSPRSRRPPTGSTTAISHGCLLHGVATAWYFVLGKKKKVGRDKKGLLLPCCVLLLADVDGRSSAVLLASLADLARIEPSAVAGRF